MLLHERTNCSTTRTKHTNLSQYKDNQLNSYKFVAIQRQSAQQLQICCNTKTISLTATNLSQHTLRRSIRREWTLYVARYVENEHLRRSIRRRQTFTSLDISRTNTLRRSIRRERTFTSLDKSRTSVVETDITDTSRNDSIWFDSESVFVTSDSIRLRFDFLSNRFDSIWIFTDLKSQNKELNLEIRSLYICLYACLVRSMRAR
jgi:hypothetical protein